MGHNRIRNQLSVKMDGGLLFAVGAFGPGGRTPGTAGGLSGELTGKREGLEK